MKAAAAAAAVVLSCASVHGNPSPAELDPAGEVGLTYQLDNGLRVHLARTSADGLVGVSMAFHAGPSLEAPGTWGSAHLLEHVMLGGSLHVSKTARNRLFGRTGSTEGGGTDLDYVSFYATGPAADVESLLWVYSDRLGYLGPTVDDERVANDVSIVRNERRLTIENDPLGHIDELLIRNLFPTPHPYHGNIIGTQEDLDALDGASVKSFYGAHFHTANVSLVIVGDIDVRELRRLVARYFGSLSRTANHADRASNASRPPERRARTSVVQDGEQPAQVAFGWAVAPIFSKDHVALQILEDYLAGGPRSLFVSELVHRQQLASDVDCYLWGAKAASIFRCSFTLTAGSEPSQVVGVVDEMIARVRAGKIGELDIESSKRRVELGLHLASESALNAAKDKNRYWVFTGDPNYRARHVARLRETTVDDIAKASQKWLTPEQSVVVRLAPTTEKRK